jgi:DNA polymerase-1
MVDVDRALEEQALATQMLLTVHDELVFEVPLAERETVEELVRDVMQSVIELRVPLVVDLGFGTNWAAAK